MAVATQRCPRCGNENSGDSYACSFCGKRLRVERIENIPFFRRYEAEQWLKPDPWYLKIFNLLVRPNRGFWDINHKRSKAPGFIILLLNSLLWGVFGLAIFSHYQISTIQGLEVSPMLLYMIAYNLSVFIAFFIFGLLFQLVFFSILVLLFTLGANYAVGFSERMKKRFGEGEEEEKGKFKEEYMSPFSIYKGGTLLQKQTSHRYRMLMCAFAPFLLINSLKILIVLIALPTVPIDTASFNLSMYDQMFESPVWTVLDVIDALTIAIWVPILIAIAIRELSNSSTFKVLISSFIVGTLVAIFFYFLRPTLFG